MQHSITADDQRGKRLTVEQQLEAVRREKEALDKRIAVIEALIASIRSDGDAKTGGDGR